MLDLIFLVLFVIIIYKANKGEVNDTMCNTAIVIGILAGVLGLVQAFFLDGEILWIMNVAVMLIAFFIKRIARHFAKLYIQKREEFEEEYRRAKEDLHFRDGDKPVYTDENFDDPSIRFGGGSGDIWKGK